MFFVWMRATLFFLPFSKQGGSKAKPPSGSNVDKCVPRPARIFALEAGNLKCDSDAWRGRQAHTLAHHGPGSSAWPWPTTLWIRMDLYEHWNKGTKPV